MGRRGCILLHTLVRWRTPRKPKEKGEKVVWCGESKEGMRGFPKLCVVSVWQVGRRAARRRPATGLKECASKYGYEKGRGKSEEGSMQNLRRRRRKMHPVCSRRDRLAPGGTVPSLPLSQPLSFPRPLFLFVSSFPLLSSPAFASPVQPLLPFPCPCCAHTQQPPMSSVSVYGEPRPSRRGPTSTWGSTFPVSCCLVGHWRSPLGKGRKKE